MSDLKVKFDHLGELVSKSKHILLVQPDKLDPDSIGSSLALKRIFEKLGKETSAYSAKEIPESLRYIPGWDEFKPDLPADFDIALLVDGAPQRELVEDHKELFAQKTFVYFDHHDARPTFPFSIEEVVDAEAAATGEMVYQAAIRLDWPMDKEIGELIGFSIIADTVYFTSSSMRLETFEAAVGITKLGVEIYDLFKKDIETSGYDLDLLKYKADLIQRIELYENGKIGFISIPKEEIQKHGDKLRPMDLIIYDIQRLKGIDIALVLSEQDDGIKGSMRANIPIAAKVAKEFGGGGHDVAAAFFIENGKLEEVKEKSLKSISKLL